MADLTHLRDLAEAVGDADIAGVESFIDTYLSDYPLVTAHLRETTRLMVAIDELGVGSPAASSSISTRFAPVLETYVTTLTLLAGEMYDCDGTDLSTLIDRYLLLYRVEHSDVTEQGHAFTVRRARMTIGAYLNEHHFVDGLSSMLDEAGEITSIDPHLTDLSKAMRQRIVQAIEAGAA